jgi:membrane protease YdiL (CAAX protease family)
VIVLRAVVIGVLAAGAATLPWAYLISANVAHGSTLAWCVPIMATYLAMYWQLVVRDRRWPARWTRAIRESARANPVPADAWGVALFAGMFGLGAVVLLQGIMARLVTLPQQRDLDPSRYPLGTMLLWVVMASFVAGIAEETGFRGYLQRPIERRFGPAAAILITGVVFGAAHLSHPEVGIALLPYYVAVAAVYGGLAYLTDSTLPSMVLHTGGNLLGAFDLFTTGRAEWQVIPAPARLVWQSGIDAAFVGAVAAFAVVSAIATGGYVMLASTMRAARRAPMTGD